MKKKKKKKHGEKGVGPGLACQVPTLLAECSGPLPKSSSSCDISSSRFSIMSISSSFRQYSSDRCGVVWCGVVVTSFIFYFPVVVVRPPPTTVHPLLALSSRIIIIIIIGSAASQRAGGAPALFSLSVLNPIHR
jgi:hypothetical protein